LNALPKRSDAVPPGLPCKVHDHRANLPFGVDQTDLIPSRLLVLGLRVGREVQAAQLRLQSVHGSMGVGLIACALSWAVQVGQWPAGHRNASDQFEHSSVIGLHMASSDQAFQ
jgi:hypothetical protein